MSVLALALSLGNNPSSIADAALAFHGEPTSVRSRALQTPRASASVIGLSAAPGRHS